MAKPARKRSTRGGGNKQTMKAARRRSAGGGTTRAGRRGRTYTPTKVGGSTGVRRLRTPPKLPSRKRDAHKGAFGRVLVIGGSRGMIGAPALAANAALRSGAGLVTVASPQSIQLAVATLCPCATSLPLPESADGMLDPQAAVALLRSSGLLGEGTAPSVVAAGPGLGRGDERFDRGWHMLLGAFGEARVPAVVDADGLNALHRASAWRGPGWDETRHFRMVITPHPGEMAALHGSAAARVQADREGLAVGTALQMSTGGTDPDHEAVVVLKGAGTVVTEGARLYVNRSGNAGMATGGSGDVLTGVIAALIGQGMATFDAAVLGVHVHGLAGDLAAKDLGEISLTATDLIDTLPAAFRRLPRSSS